jgi:hypothetical protein
MTTHVTRAEHFIYTDDRYKGWLVDACRTCRVTGRPLSYQFGTLTEACRFARQELGCTQFRKIDDTCYAAKA